MGLLGNMKSKKTLRRKGVDSTLPATELPNDGDRLSRAELCNLVSNTEEVLTLTEVSDDIHKRLAHLCFNGVAVELRDMFRMLEGLQQKAKRESVSLEDISTFYDWFEGFYGIITCIFDTEEDVLFSWLEKVGAIKMENALAPKRRKTKKERAKDLCWDILELKIQFDKKGDRKVSLNDLVFEMKDEAEQMASRVMTYLQTLVEELPDLLEEHFRFDERRMIEDTVIGNYRATEPGKFVICAYSRGIVNIEKKNGFLENSLRTPKSAKATVPKQIRKFRKKHTELVDGLAVRELLIENAE